jgi:hypothetical protein
MPLEDLQIPSTNTTNSSDASTGNPYADNAGLYTAVSKSSNDHTLAEMTALGTKNQKTSALEQLQMPGSYQSQKTQSGVMTLDQFQNQWKPGEQEMSKEAQDLQKLQVLGKLRFDVQDMFKAATGGTTSTVETPFKDENGQPLTGPALYEHIGLTPDQISDPGAVEAAMRNAGMEVTDSTIKAATSQLASAAGKLTVSELMTTALPEDERVAVGEILTKLGLDPNTTNLSQLETIVNQEIDKQSQNVNRARAVLSDPAASPSMKAEARRELIRLGATGDKAMVQQSEELSDQLKEEQQVTIAGETFETMEEALQSDVVSQKIAEAFSEDETTAKNALEELKKWGLGDLEDESSFLGKYAESLGAMTASLDESVQTAVKNTEQFNKIFQNDSGVSFSKAAISMLTGKDSSKDFITADDLTDFQEGGKYAQFASMLRGDLKDADGNVIPVNKDDRKAVLDIINEYALSGDSDSVKKIMQIAGTDPKTVTRLARTHDTWKRAEATRSVVSKLSSGEYNDTPEAGWAALKAAKIPGMDAKQVDMLRKAGLSLQEVSGMFGDSFDTEGISFNDLAAGWSGVGMLEDSKMFEVNKEQATKILSTLKGDEASLDLLDQLDGISKYEYDQAKYRIQKAYTEAQIPMTYEVLDNSQMQSYSNSNNRLLEKAMKKGDDAEITRLMENRAEEFNDRIADVQQRITDLEAKLGSGDRLMSDSVIKKQIEEANKYIGELEKVKYSQPKPLAEKMKKYYEDRASAAFQSKLSNQLRNMSTPTVSL